MEKWIKNILILLVSLLILGCDGGGPDRVTFSNGAAPSGQQNQFKADASLSGEITGTYKPDLEDANCFGDNLNEVDLLQIQVQDSKLPLFEINANYEEVPQSYQNNKLKFTFSDESLTSISCELLFQNDLAVGNCTVDHETCPLFYEKCSDNPNDQEECNS